MGYEFHEFSMIYPMMDKDSFVAMVNDIASIGKIIHSIDLFEGKILDGRNRYNACLKCGVTPTFTEFKGTRSDALDYVIRQNSLRRNLDSSANAAVAARSDNLFRQIADDAKQRQVANLKQGDKTPVVQKIVPRGESAKTDTILAKRFNTNPQYIRDARKLDNDDPDILDRVVKGKLNIPQAKQTAKIIKKNESIKSKLLSRIDAGEKFSKIKTDITKKEIQDSINSEVSNSPNQPIIDICDATDWLNSQDQADLIITDPPYATDVEDINLFAKSWLPIALSKMKPTGRAYIFIGAYPEELAAYINISHPDQILVWTYRNTMGPSPKANYKQNWQAILYYKGDQAKDLNCKSLNELFSVKDINAPDGRQANRYHEWQKPAEIGEQFVRHATNKGDVILDPFCCTGTFLIAATKLGRIAKGCDNNIDNAKIAESLGCKINILK